MGWNNICLFWHPYLKAPVNFALFKSIYFQAFLDVERKAKHIFGRDNFLECKTIFQPPGLCARKFEKWFF
jgi:hypothetical protein